LLGVKNGVNFARDFENMCDPWGPYKKRYVEGGKPLNVFASETEQKYLKKNMVFLHMVIFLFEKNDL